MLQALLKEYFSKLRVTHKSYSVEDILYKNEVYPIYCRVQSNFKHCMKNKLLKRNDILEFKHILNSSINKNEFKYEKFENDAHEIYRKLKSNSITKKQMKKLDDFLNPYLK